MLLAPRLTTFREMTVGHVRGEERRQAAPSMEFDPADILRPALSPL